MCYHRVATTTTDWLGLASTGSNFEPAGIGSTGHRGNFWQLLTEATAVAPLLPKPSHANPIRYLKKTHKTNKNPKLTKQGLLKNFFLPI